VVCGSPCRCPAGSQTCGQRLWAVVKINLRAATTWVTDIRECVEDAGAVGLEDGVFVPGESVREMWSMFS
jgi:hypothetical protein